VAVKPDYANAHYNLAAAYKAKGDTADAKTELTTVLSLLDKNSADYQKAKTDLDNIGSAEITPPAASPAPTTVPAITPAIELPQEATPPAASPTP
jgi:hypothetical protein